MKIDVDLNFEEIDKLPIDEYRKLEERFIKMLTKSIGLTQEDYCKKKGWKLNEILQDYPKYHKMMIAVNKRKFLRKLANTCMMFNKLLRPYII